MNFLSSVHASGSARIWTRRVPAKEPSTEGHHQSWGLVLCAPSLITVPSKLPDRVPSWDLIPSSLNASTYRYPNIGRLVSRAPVKGLPLMTDRNSNLYMTTSRCVQYRVSFVSHKTCIRLPKPIDPNTEHRNRFSHYASRKNGSDRASDTNKS